jgi:hypothetical protein
MPAPAGIQCLIEIPTRVGMMAAYFVAGYLTSYLISNHYTHLYNQINQSLDSSVN